MLNIQYSYGGREAQNGVAPWRFEVWERWKVVAVVVMVVLAVAIFFVYFAVFSQMQTRGFTKVKAN